MSHRHHRGFNGRPFDAAEILRTARVTDHALIRWLERVEGMPMERMRMAILTRPAVLQALALGATSLQLPDVGARLILDDRRVVTVLNLGDSA